MNRLFAVLLAALLSPTPALRGAEMAPRNRPRSRRPRSRGRRSRGSSSARSGPAVTSGRVIDIAVRPGRTSTWYVAVASRRGVEDDNAGTSWTPIFDARGLVLDRLRHRRPPEPARGLGRDRREQQPAQRRVRRRRLSVASTAGKTLGEPRARRLRAHRRRSSSIRANSKVVYVAAQGPLWAPGGDRGSTRRPTAGRPGRRS